ncbi:MAG: malto-oligosyltrehalose synthase [Spirochaetes bacterium]|jgi:malto-oligosyltrehalose synthase|nr:malto-oligosyltrehalose synthase [Spirochaetota bacterium]
MYNPISTYRIQFHKQFDFQDADNLVAYFDKLGIGTLYASPIFEAVKGSAHGYDGINPHAINPEIGTRKELDKLHNKLKKVQIGWLQDIVPNHLAYDTSNPWLADVLEKGQQSPFSCYFDINWLSSEPLMVPFLGTDLNTALKNNVIEIVFINGRFYFNVYEQNYPVNLSAYSKILRTVSVDIQSILHRLLKDTPELRDNENEFSSWDSFITDLSNASSNSKEKDHIHSCLKRINNSEKLLSELLHEQTYQLCHWQRTHKEINYRRFFTVNGLICLNIQDKKVFDAYHQTIFELLREGVFQGLRIDHVDGLYDPVEYLERLRKAAGKETYIVVEKILEHDEVIPRNWPVEGATGYSFLATVNNLLTYNKSEKQFADFYRSISRDKDSLAQQIKSRKKFILCQRMAGELENLFCDLKHALVSLNIEMSQIDSFKLKEVIGAFLIEFPVYRFYGRQMPLPSDEAAAVADIFDEIIHSHAELREAAALLQKFLLEDTGNGNDTFDQRMLHFYRRMMQISGPLMAKGVEDTLMYSYNRFIGHNEVGDSLEVFGISISEWHDKMRDRMAHHPLTMNTTSTHDTKRGEDVRARLNVVTEIPEIWFQNVTAFRKMNNDLKINSSPDLNDEYSIYLTLLGMYPMPGEPDDDVSERLQEYIPKALREAKTHSNWTNPEEDYEDKVSDFTLSLLDKSRPFWKAFTELHSKISDFGIINSISQLILKCTSPGIPDIYQGTELWDLSLVDPDNRRPVNYRLRICLLDELQQLSSKEPEGLWENLWEERYNGKIKLRLTRTLMQYRRANPDLFMSGEYLPLKVNGEYKNSVVAFIRQYGEKWLLVAVPLFMAKLCNADRDKILSFDWKDTEIILPGHAPRTWQSILKPDSTLDAVGAVGLNTLYSNTLPIVLYEGG